MKRSSDVISLQCATCLRSSLSVHLSGVSRCFAGDDRGMQNKVRTTSSYRCRDSALYSEQEELFPRQHCTADRILSLLITLTIFNILINNAAVQDTSYTTHTPNHEFL